MSAGIGIALEQSALNGNALVKRLIPDGNAAVGGRLRAGDEILAIDGFSVIGTGHEAAGLIVGPEGTCVPPYFNAVE